MDSKITRDEVRHVALLARLELSEAEEELMTGQMNGILGYMDKLNRTRHKRRRTHHACDRIAKRIPPRPGRAVP